MGFKKFTLGLLILFLILFLVLARGCSKHVLIDEQNTKLLNYNFKIANLENIDKTLSNQRYSYSTNIKKYVAVVTYQSKNASIKQYLINNDGTVNFTVPKDSHFIISLPANRIITYTWNIKNNIDNGVIKFESRSWIDIPMPRSERGTVGMNYDRQNFYFKTIKSGNEKVVMRYEHQTEQRSEFFEITFNIKIE
jgi:predicted secreted protein